MPDPIENYRELIGEARMRDGYDAFHRPRPNDVEYRGYDRAGADDDDGRGGDEMSRGLASALENDPPAYLGAMSDRFTDLLPVIGAVYGRHDHPDQDELQARRQELYQQVADARERIEGLRERARSGEAVDEGELRAIYDRYLETRDEAEDHRERAGMTLDAPSGGGGGDGGSGGGRGRGRGRGPDGGR